ncbi:type II toxin-antitoxin system HicB family antitoxin [Xanthobacter wiegelii]|uniref:type II toxin-antitoxin system HicB family antitoxin n=1 Tax=Xanthobacter wiegelii TaxID=3119913 RepID=UPI0037286AE7
MNHVIGIIREEAGGFRLSFPEFPGLQADGETLATAVAHAAEVVAAELAERNADFPAAANTQMLDAAQPDWMGRGIAVLVPLPLRAASAQADAGQQVPGDGASAEGQVPRSGRVSPAEVPTDQARAVAREKTDGAPVQRSTDDL